MCIEVNEYSTSQKCVPSYFPMITMINNKNIFFESWIPTKFRKSVKILISKKILKKLWVL